MHKATLVWSNHTKANQIDHIWINKEFGRSMKDVRRMREFDMTSDHRLVGAKIKLKLQKHQTTGETALKKFNAPFLRDTDKLNELKTVLKNRFEALRDLLKELGTTMGEN